MDKLRQNLNIYKIPMAIAAGQTILFALFMWLQWYGRTSREFGILAIFPLGLFFLTSVATIKLLYIPRLENWDFSKRLKTFGLCVLGSFIILVAMKLVPTLLLLLSNPARILNSLSMMFSPLAFLSMVPVVILQYVSLAFLKKHYRRAHAESINPTTTIQEKDDNGFPIFSTEEYIVPGPMKWHEPLTVKFALLVLFITLLQFVPIVNFIVIMFGMALLGPYIWGLLPHLITVGLVADVITKRFSRAVLILPVLGYCGYYAAYAFEYAAIQSAEAKLRERNPARIMTLDSRTHAIAMQGAEYLASTLKTPVVYEPNSNFPEGFFAYRLVSPELCNKFRSLKLKWNDGYNPRFPQKGKTLGLQLKQCRIRRPEAPAKQLVHVMQASSAENLSGVSLSKTTYSFKQGEKTLGTFEQASVERLPIFPFFFFGYFPKLPEARDGGLFAKFYRHRIELDTFADALDREKYGTPIAAMLGIEKYQEGDFATFTDYPENKALIERLLETKEKSPEEFYRLQFEHVDLRSMGLHGETPLMKTVSEGNLPAMRVLIDMGADVNAADRSGNTALMRVKEGNPDIIKLLIEKGANVSAMTVEGRTPLIAAASSGNVEAARLLLNAGAAVNQHIEDKLSGGVNASPLIAASFYGNKDMAQFLLDNGADMSLTTSSKWTALHMAVNRGHADIVRLLLDRGIDTTAKDRNGKTALQASQDGQYRHADIRQMLEERAAGNSASPPVPLPANGQAP
jgi:ankyrin repeat protein/membrane protein CcdC involved in cytochrome C biogenesis